MPSPALLANPHSTFPPSIPPIRRRRNEVVVSGRIQAAPERPRQEAFHLGCRFLRRLHRPRPPARRWLRGPLERLRDFPLLDFAHRIDYMKLYEVAHKKEKL